MFMNDDDITQIPEDEDNKGGEAAAKKDDKESEFISKGFNAPPGKIRPK